MTQLKCKLKIMAVVFTERQMTESEILREMNMSFEVVPAWNFKISENMRELIHGYLNGTLAHTDNDVYEEMRGIMDMFMSVMTDDDAKIPSVKIEVNTMEIGETKRVCELDIIENHLYAVCSIILSYTQVPVCFTRSVTLYQQCDEETGVYHTYCTRMA
jgi:hypothetical protein